MTEGEKKEKMALATLELAKLHNGGTAELKGGSVITVPGAISGAIVLMLIESQRSDKTIAEVFSHLSFAMSLVTDPDFREAGSVIISAGEKSIQRFSARFSEREQGVLN